MWNHSISKSYNYFKNKTHLRTYCIAQGSIIYILQKPTREKNLKRMYVCV